MSFKCLISLLCRSYPNMINITEVRDDIRDLVMFLFGQVEYILFLCVCQQHQTWSHQLIS